MQMSCGFVNRSIIHFYGRVNGSLNESLTFQCRRQSPSVDSVDRFLFTFNFAFLDLIGPGADAGLAVVGQARGALVAGSLAVPAAPEDVAFAVVGEDTVEARAVASADRGLCSQTCKSGWIISIFPE